VKLNSQSYLAHYYYAAMSMGPTGRGQDPEIESSLRTCIQLNPDFAPAYDALAMYYRSDPAKVNEAHKLNIRAISLEPDNLNYRLNAALLLVNNQRYDDAIAVLKAASHVARTPEQVATVQTRMGQVEQYRAAAAQSRQQEKVAAMRPTATSVTDTRTNTITSSDGRTFVIKPDTAQDTRKYPTEAPTGLHHTVRGVLRGVQCGYPSVITFNLERSGTPRTLLLYRNDFKQIEFSATNFTPKGDLNPCTDMEGLKAKVQYAEVSDKSVAGQVISVELSK
jgi:hypothetical protein